MFDIVIPKNNEKKFILIAKELGFDALIFLYNDLKEALDLKKKLKILSSDNISLYAGVFVKKSNASSLKKKGLITFLDYKNISELNRFIDVIINCEAKSYYKYLHRRQALSYVDAKKLKENNILLAESQSYFFSNFKKSPNIIQNVKLANKYKLKMAFFSFAKDPKKMSYYHDLYSFSVAFGIRPELVKVAMSLDSFVF